MATQNNNDQEDDNNITSDVGNTAAEALDTITYGNEPRIVGAEGATLDKLKGSDASWSDLYDMYRKKEEKGLGKFETNNQVLSTLGQVAGLLTPTGEGALIGKAGKELGKLGELGASAATGAAGASLSDESNTQRKKDDYEGTSLEQYQKPDYGSDIAEGATISPAIGMLGKFLEKPIQGIIDLVAKHKGGDEEKARQLLEKELFKGKNGAADLLHPNSGPTLADRLYDHAPTGSIRGALNSEDPSVVNAFKKDMQERTLNRPDELKQLVDKHLYPVEDKSDQDILSELKTKRRQETSPLYERAFSTKEFPLDEASREDLTDHDFEKYIQRNEKASNRAQKNKERLSLQTGEPINNPFVNKDAKDLHSIVSGLGEDAEDIRLKDRFGNANADERSLLPVMGEERRRIDQNLQKNIPGYREAQNEYKKYSSGISHFTEKGDFLNRPSRNISDQLGTEPEKEGARAAAARDIYNLLDASKGGSSSKALDALSSNNAKENISKIAKDPETFLNEIERNRRMQELEDLVAKHDTPLKEGSDLSSTVSAVAGAKFHPSYSAGKLFSKIVGPSPKIQTEKLKLLAEKDPSKQEAFRNYFAERRQQKKDLEEKYLPYIQNALRKGTSEFIGNT